MKKIIPLFLTGAVIASCQSNKDTSNADGAFDGYKNRFIENYWSVYPDYATNVGFHKYDSVLKVPDLIYQKQQLDFAAANLDSLKSFDLEKLSDANKTDFHLIENQLKSIQFGINELKSGEWDPSNYNICGVFSYMLSEKYEGLNSRLKSISLKLANVPAYYEAAKNNIKNPTKEHTSLAIEQNIGGSVVFEKDLLDSVNKSGLTADEKAQLISRSKAAFTAVKNYADWLKQFKNETPRSFRLGAALYQKKFNYEIQSAYTADEIYEIASKRKIEIHAEMAKLTEQLWPKYFGSTAKPSDKLVMIRKMIDTLSVHHVKSEEFQSSIEKQIPELEAFVKQKDLLYIDPSKPLVVRKEPAYMAGVAGASISAPGPYDKGGNTYYNVGSLEGWPKDKAESYLREYNHYILQILNIHEAIPGHYTQLVYANQSPSIIKSVFGNGAMVEGWAVYAERMMLEAGYGNNEPEMWLMYYKWHLRTLCNTLLDYNVHVKNQTEQDAVKFLTNEAFQQQAEAEGKWKRVSVTQVQLTSYFTGFTEIFNLREELKKIEGDKFNLKQFHEKFLSYGSAPVKYIKELIEK
ncbi:DUF885 domain-containing protein [Solitalea canadensis]|uniref:Lipoprotein n=1 Tax=Solitalea canadensis (strain ATCC 29591 / DSM 3403 / JCM 21819 / LMG 8368 / NBRC 15130 / NCIMB 12057 / USAM 9D) TaxID=929556 RepID=H8KVD1_SOLCM|nr:DUF885 domain-containing protein [Solitalea canadensis]AFD06311.1 hypothetical protein Solca_1211 [Solitalea canadensis DSM 3403]